MSSAMAMFEAVESSGGVPIRESPSGFDNTYTRGSRGSGGAWEQQSRLANAALEAHSRTATGRSDVQVGGFHRRLVTEQNKALPVPAPQVSTT